MQRIYRVTLRFLNRPVSEPDYVVSIRARWRRIAIDRAHLKATEAGYHGKFDVVCTEYVGSFAEGVE